MIRAFHSELRKLRSRTYLIGLVGMAAFIVVAMLVSIGGAGDAVSDRGPAGLVLDRGQLTAADGLGRSLGNGVTFLGIAAMTIAAINVGAEFSGRTIDALLVRQPRRARLLGGKLAALGSYTAVATAAAGLVGIAAAAAFAVGNDLDVGAWWTPTGVAATAAGLLNLTVAVVGWAAIGALVATVTRSPASAIGVGVGYALPVEILLTELVEGAGSTLPGQAFQALARGGTPALDHAAAAGRSALWIVGAAATAIVVFVRRDLTT